eukprot:929625-Prymnesium_polylepis.1
MAQPPALDLSRDFAKGVTGTTAWCAAIGSAIAEPDLLAQVAEALRGAKLVTLAAVRTKKRGELRELLQPHDLCEMIDTLEQFAKFDASEDFEFGPDVVAELASADAPPKKLVSHDLSFAQHISLIYQ